MKGNIFIKRPVMAISISVLILAIGLISLFTLPVEQYPDIAPPTVYVAASYTGADAEAVMNSVIMPLEESINGVEDMMYITSSASNAGLAIIQVYFKQGTDPDMAAVNVQNRVAKAQGLLPAEVTKVGVSTMKRQTSFLQIGAMVCTDGRYDQTFLANYLDINVIPQIKRIEGVGDVMELGDTYSMRIWLKPERMAQYGLVPSDITGVLGEQNIEAPTGSLGESSQNVFQFTMKYRGRLKSVEEFQNTVVRSREDGSILRLKDVADVELGTMTYSFRSEMDSQPAVLYMIFQTAGSNATAVNKEITAQMERMEKNLPEGTEFVTMMTAASSYKDSNGTDTGVSLFKDVKSDHWASEYIKLAVEQGWITGYVDGTFRPNNTVTLEEACTALLRMLGYDSSSLAGTFPTAQLSKASAVGLLDGMTATRGQKLTRSDCVSLLNNLLTP